MSKEAGRLIDRLKRFSGLFVPARTIKCIFVVSYSFVVVRMLITCLIDINPMLIEADRRRIMYLGVP